MRPLRGDVLRHAGVAVARQIGEDKVGVRLSGPPYLEEVHGLSAARRVAGFGDLGAHQRVDQARLAHVRPAKEGDLRRTRRRELPRVNRGRHKARQHLHGITIPKRSRPKGLLRSRELLVVGRRPQLGDAYKASSPPRMIAELRVDAIADKRMAQSKKQVTGALSAPAPEAAVAPRFPAAHPRLRAADAPTHTPALRPWY